MKRLKSYIKILLSIVLIFSFSSCTFSKNQNENYLSSEISLEEEKEDNLLDENKAYYSMEDVSLYIYSYGKLPKNYLTKNEAKALGWDPKEGNLWQVTDKGVIGGDRFNNYEKILPDANYKEADVNYEGGRRNAERLVFDEDGNIYYSKDHYESFERVYWW